MFVQMWTPDFKRRGTLPAFSGKGTITLNGLGSFEVTVDGADPAWARFGPGWRVTIHDERTGQIFHSGIPEQIKRSRTTRDDVTLICVDEMHVLADMVTLPSPGKDSGAQDRAFWQAEGPAGNVIRDLVRAQIGPTAHKDYQARHLDIPAPTAVGKTVKVQTRYRNLLEEVAELAGAGGLNVRVTHTGMGQRLDITQGRDLRRRVRLSEDTDSLSGFELEERAPQVTEVIVGGVGDGANRKLWRVTGDRGEWGRNIVRFEDRRATSDATEGRQAGEEIIRENQAKTSVTLDVVEPPQMRYGEAWQLGDTITVDLADGGHVTDVVTEIEYEWGPTGRTITPTIGDPDSDPYLKKITDLARKLRDLQRST